MLNPKYLKLAINQTQINMNLVICQTQKEKYRSDEHAKPKKLELDSQPILR
jgi:hypothetical protein